jgi:hypothetical protein
MTKVPTRPPGGESPPDGGREPRSIADAAIRAGVIGSLGRPEDLYQVTVRSLWPGWFRVNVWTGADATSARVAHSYFVSADDGGMIASSVPKITRQYP